jgi:hypothetical protein
MYSLRAEVNLGDLHRHLMNVTIRCKDAPIILVGTHLDAIGGGASLPLRDLKARYPQVRTADLVELTARSLAYPALRFSVITLAVGLGSRGLKWLSLLTLGGAADSQHVGPAAVQYISHWRGHQ